MQPTLSYNRCKSSLQITRIPAVRTEYMYPISANLNKAVFGFCITVYKYEMVLPSDTEGKSEYPLCNNQIQK